MKRSEVQRQHDTSAAGMNAGRNIPMNSLQASPEEEHGAQHDHTGTLFRNPGDEVMEEAAIRLGR